MSTFSIAVILWEFGLEGIFRLGCGDGIKERLALFFIVCKNSVKFSR